MARGRSPKRDEALRLWLESNGQAKLVDIAKQVGVSDSQVRKWKNIDDWDGILNGNVTNESNGNVTKRGAPEGNQNAVGNTGGAPQGNRNATGNIGGFAPLGNKNARTTGEYESILFDELDDKEKELFHVVDASPYAQIDENIRVLTIREKRMLQRIKDATDGLNEKEIRVLKQRRNVKQAVEFEDPNTYKKTKRVVDGYKMVPVEEETTQFRKIDDILKLEDALSRIQALKQKAIKQYFEMTHVFDHKQHIDTERLALDKKKAQKEKDLNESFQITIKRKEARAGETND